MTNFSERRGCERFQIDLDVHISGVDPEGAAFFEKTSLYDISGEGARFLTSSASRYFPGQMIEIAIRLPETPEVAALMKATAVVLRIGDALTGTHAAGEEKKTVAVKITAPLNFERLI